MSNALLLNWLNLATALANLPKSKQPVSKKQLTKCTDDLFDWYAKFTDTPNKQLQAVAKSAAKWLKRPAAAPDKAVHSAVYCAVEFLNAYREPLEMVNMAHFGADKKTVNALRKMTAGLSGFDAKLFQSFDWLVSWLEQSDPLFPSAIFRNKMRCCLADVKQKPCYTQYRRCLFEPSLEWIRTPSAQLTGLFAQDDCCKGSTLSSCSGGTLYCDCVAGNTGCDCKAPKQLCQQNEKSVSVSSAGFGGITCTLLDPTGEETSGGKTVVPLCLALDPVPDAGCILEASATPPNPVCQALDPAAGRFTSNPAMAFDLGRLMLSAKDCTQTGFCPPKSGGCSGLC